MWGEQVKVCLGLGINGCVSGGCNLHTQTSHLQSARSMLSKMVLGCGVNAEMVAVG